MLRIEEVSPEERSRFLSRERVHRRIRMLGIVICNCYPLPTIRDDVVQAEIRIANMIVTQHSLVARMRTGGSNEDWSRFYRLYEKPILAFAASHSLDQSECADVLQETMVRMLRAGFSRFNPDKGRFTGFLFNIAKCSAIDAVRRRARAELRHVSLDAVRPNHSTSLGEELSGNSLNPAEVAERNGQMALILVTIDFLVEQKRFHGNTVDIFKAVTLQQKDASEVAKALGTTVGNVYEAKRAVLVKLRAMLKELDKGLDLEQALVAGTGSKVIEYE